MKKKTILIASGLVLLLVIVFVFRTHPLQPWQAVTDQYLQNFGYPRIHFYYRARVKASHPEKFLSYMSRETYSDSLIFKTNHNLHAGDGAGKADLTYPPKEVYCVTGELSYDQSEFFFVALHTDGPDQAWVVHKPNASWDNIRKIIDEIGCDIPRY